MSNLPNSDLEPIQQLISRTRRLLRSSWMLTGMAIVCAIMLGTLFLAASADMLLTLWTSFRWVALAAVLIPTFWALAVGVLKAGLRRLGSRNVARNIEKNIPEIHNRLLSCVDLADEREDRPLSAAFRQRLVDETKDRVQVFDPWTVLDFTRMRRASLAAAVVMAIFVLTWLMLSTRFSTAIARIFRPWADIPPTTGVVYKVAPGDSSVLRGDPIEFVVDVEAGDPNDLQIEISTDDGNAPLRYDLRRRNNHRWTLALSSFEKSFDYRVTGGGTWTLPYHITMVDRPKIVSLHATLHFPKYFGPVKPRPNPPQTADIAGPEQSEVEVTVGAEGDVARGEIRLYQLKTRQIPATERPERIWFDEKVPDGATCKGTWQWDHKEPERASHSDPAAQGVHGHFFLNASNAFAVKPEEMLFTYVYIPADASPKTLMLKYHDGQRWGHQVYWGEEQASSGKSANDQHCMGPLPTPGRWVRLEVPAGHVGLEGKPLRGMAFGAVGGQCLWHKAGALPSAMMNIAKLVRTDALPMQTAGKGQWTDRFPLLHDGYYRVHLENELKAGNLTMKEGKFTAIPDRPPQIVLERPDGDLTLSAPQKVPLAASVYDDFALDEVRIAVQKSESESPGITTLKKYSGIVCSDTAVLSLDLEPFKLKPGDQIRYHLEARDRKGQTVSTVERIIRIAADNNAADQQLARFEKEQKDLQEKLAKLIAQQNKTNEENRRIEAKYATVDQKIQEAKTAAQNASPAGSEPKQTEVDPETLKQLEQQRQEIAAAATAQEQNAAAARQLTNELNHLAEQASQQQMLPPEILAEFREAQKTFEHTAVQPMQQLAAEMKQESTAKQPDSPPMADWQRRGENAGKEMESLAQRLKALEQARNQLKAGAEEALAKLRNELLRQQASDAARELQQLRNMMAGLQKELQHLEGRQLESLDTARTAHESAIPELAKKQDSLERQEAGPLAEAGELLQHERPRRMKQPSQASDLQNRQEGEDSSASQEQSAQSSPEAKSEEKPNAQTAGKEAQKNEKQAERIYEPALGGPSPKLDPRIAEKQPAPKAADTPATASTNPDRREELQSREFQKLTELNMAQQSLGSDIHSLDKLLSQLPQDHKAASSDAQQPNTQQPQGAQQAQGSQLQSPDAQQTQSSQQQSPSSQQQQGSQQQTPDSQQAQSSQPQTPDPQQTSGSQQAAEMQQGDPSEQQLSQLMQSPAMERAMEMATRLQAARAAGRAQRNPQQSQAAANPSQGQNANTPALFGTRGDMTNQKQLDKQLRDLDPATRSMILKMQPRVREELLQGMREQGPEGYRQFIREYFQRLSKVDDKNK